MFPPFHPCQYPHVHATKTRISGDYFQSSCLTQSTYSKLLLERLSEAVKDVETLLCRSNGAENQIFILPTEHQLYNYSLVKSASVPASNGECTFQIYQICLVWRLVPSRRFLQLKSTLNKVYLIDQESIKVKRGLVLLKEHKKPTIVRACAFTIRRIKVILSTLRENYISGFRRVYSAML